MKTNRFVQVERNEAGLVMRKSRGELTLQNILDALQDENDEDNYVMFIRAPVFDGWVGEDGPLNKAELKRIDPYEACPVCQRDLAELRNQQYGAGYEDGIKVGRDQALKECGVHDS